jgi:chromosome partitioning protein
VNQRATLLEGSLEDIELANVVQTISVSRRSVALELREPGGAVFGTLVLKAGQIVSVASEGLSGIDALRKLVVARRPGRFLVYRATGADLREHLGPVADVLSNVLAGSAPSARGTVLAQGSLEKFALRTVLEALSLSRQSVTIELFAADDSSIGALSMKSGQVLGARCGGETGMAAAGALLGERTEGRFVVTRDALAAHVEPLIALRALLRPPGRDESLLEVGDEDIAEADDAEEVQPMQVAARPAPSQSPARSRPPPLPAKSQPPVRHAPSMPPPLSRPPAREAGEPGPSAAPQARPSAVPNAAPGTRPSVPFGREFSRPTLPASASGATHPPLAAPAVPAEIPGARTEPRASAPWLDAPLAAPSQPAAPSAGRTATAGARSESPHAARPATGGGSEPQAVQAATEPRSEPQASQTATLPRSEPQGLQAATGPRSEAPSARQTVTEARSEPPSIRPAAANVGSALDALEPRSEAPPARTVNGTEPPAQGVVLPPQTEARVNGARGAPQAPASLRPTRPPAEPTSSSLPRGDLAPAVTQRDAPRGLRSEPPATPPRTARTEPPAGDADSTSRRAASDATITARHQAVRAGTPIIAITSPKGGAGRSTLALNLAVSLARRGRRVVMVDADASNLLPALNLADRPFKGVADALEGWAPLADTVLDTRVPGLKLIPSGDLSEETYRHPGWQQLLTTLAQQADLVLVDCAPGWYGATLSVLEAATHQLLVLAADPAAHRLCAAYQARLQKLLKGKTKPELLGLVINMLDYQTHASVRSLEELSTSEYARHVFDIPVPRSAAFMEASARGVPIVHVEQGASPTIAWVFETLATALLERLQLERPALASAPLLA